MVVMPMWERTHMLMLSTKPPMAPPVNAPLIFRTIIIHFSCVVSKVYQCQTKKSAGEQQSKKLSAVIF
jgi:hypothetical protein